jgi:ring-1,2-phenylacetyl-CoA epoxidase subunit PaaE
LLVFEKNVSLQKNVAMTKFYPLKVKKINPETNDCVSLTFEVPSEWAAFFQFTQGQYLTLRTNIDGTEVRRSYSICSAVGEGLSVAVKKIEGGLFSTFANTVLRVGDTLDVMPPMGRFFTPLTPSQSKHYVAFASGSGITPVFSILKSVLLTEPNSRFTLFYGNKNAKSVIFREAIEGLKNKYMERLRVYHVLSREFQEAELFNGRLDADKCAAFFTQIVDVQSVDEIFLCGPEDMILGIKSQLMMIGMAAEKIHFELFTTQSAKKTNHVDNNKNVNTLKMSQVEVKLDGKIFAFPLAQSGENILDAAMNEGADLPYACKGGVCCTCKCKVTEGEVFMDINYGLEPDEIEAGYVLSCQAHPRSEKVVVDFDV